jgi:hypothetical protein
MLSLCLAAGCRARVETPATATSRPVEPTPDLCLEQHELLVTAGDATEQAAVTSYRCHTLHVDSTGWTAPPTPTLTLAQGAPIDVRFAAGLPPSEVELRLYPVPGAAGSFGRWPDELPTGHEPVDVFLPTPGAELRYSVADRRLGALSGVYSLVVRATWQEEVSFFYTISLNVK